MKKIGNVQAKNRFLLSTAVWLAFVVVTLGANPSDPSATAEATRLFHILETYANNPQKIMFGHHESTLFGGSGGHRPYILGQIHDGHQSWLYSVEQAKSQYPDELCDIKDVTGEYPAVVGFDLGDLNPDYMIRIGWLIKKAHERGMINTVSWHQNNPISNGSPWVDQDHTGVDISHSIRRLLDNGDHSAQYRHRLDTIADWFKSLTDKDGHQIPILFRPYHEMNGGWFWWGTSQKTGNTPDDFKNFYRFTVTYLRNTKGVHNLLMSYSPNRYQQSSEYLQFYPGDEYVDVFGLDYYYNLPFNPPTSDLQSQVQFMVDVAKSHGKMAAITELGIFNNGLMAHHNFWIDHVLHPLKTGQSTTNVAYILAWESNCLSQCEPWVPYKGHPAENDFRNFYNDPVMIFGPVMAASGPIVG